MSTNNPYDTTNAYTLVYSTNVVGPYVPATGTTWTSNNGVFQVTVPESLGNTNNVFYRLLHKP